MAYGYLVFGSATSSASALDLATISAANGNGLKTMVADASSADDHDLIFSNVGDVNNDGYQDFAIGAPFAGTGGQVFVIFGKAFFSADLDLISSSFASTNGFTLAGGGVDINWDTLVQNTNAGGVWVIYGIASIGDQTLPGGTTASEDLFIDGYPNALIGSKARMAWVIYGGQSTTSYDLPSYIPATDGYMVSGWTRTSVVAKAGDFDGDGINDFLVTKGAYGTSRTHLLLTNPGDYTTIYESHSTYSGLGWSVAGGLNKPVFIDVKYLTSHGNDGQIFTKGFSIKGAFGDQAQTGYAVAFAVSYQGAGSSYTIYGASSQTDFQLTAMITFPPTIAPTLAPTMAPSAAPTTPNQQDDGHRYDNHLSGGGVAALVAGPIVGVNLIACAVYWVICCMRVSAVTKGDAVPQHASNV
eukprot:scaffold1534_cov158-Ochromonas_danica.AAC.10